MNNPLISIIIPVYNHANVLRRCLRSVFAETYRPIEVIVVNDGSSDDFNEVIKKIKAEVNSNIILFSQTNSGASAARNYGFEKSTGEYVIFWDADTIAKPKMLERLKNALDEHPEASYAYSRFRFGWKKFGCRPFNADSLKKINYIDTTVLIRRSELPRKPFDENIRRFQDWDLWLTLLGQNKIGTFVPRVLFRKIVGSRKGISSWIPSLAYFFRGKRVQEYEAARKIVLSKHGLE